MWQPIDEMPKDIDKTPTKSEIITHPRSYKRGHQLGLHAHSQAQLLYVATGLVNVTTPIGRFLAPPQKAVWIPPMVEHSVDALTDIEMRSVYIESSWLLRHSKLSQLNEVYVIEVNSLLRELILATHKEKVNDKKIDLLMNLALLELSQAKDASTFLPMPIDIRAKKVAQLALDDTQSSKSFEQLCYEANASSRTITRLFTKETKLNFREWRQRARIMNALELLEDGSRSIKQISLRLGFSSTASFAHSFREVMGVTPTEFSNLNL
jgi:AraC-like DNA-binding protein